MNVGISTACLYPMSTEKSVEFFINAGFNLFEVFLNTFSELEDSLIKRINNLIKANNCIVKSVHPFAGSFESFMLFSNYEKRFDDGLKFYEKYFCAAEKLGAKIMVLHGDNSVKSFKISDEEYFDRFFVLSNNAKKHGIILAQENVNLFRSGSLNFIRKMRDYLKDEAHFVLDIKQAIRANEDPFKMCEIMGNGLVHVHLNDNTKTEDCLLPFNGSMNYNKLLNILNKIAFSGDIIIEIYINNFKNIQEIIKSYNKAKSFFK